MGLALELRRTPLTVPETRFCVEGRALVAADVSVDAPDVTLFASILFDSAEGSVRETAPDHFKDLNLDQLVEAVVASRRDYNLVPFFHTPLSSAGAVAYRQQVFGDLEQEAVAACVHRFADSMRQVRAELGNAVTLHYELQRHFWQLAAVGTYVHAVEQLTDALLTLPISSAGLAGFTRYLSDYRSGAPFRALRSTAARLSGQLDALTYRVQVRGDQVRVGFEQGEPDTPRTLRAPSPGSGRARSRVTRSGCRPICR